MAAAVGCPVKDLNEADTASWKDIVWSARCWRCGGLMVAEPCTDFWDNIENLEGKRCVQCGEVIDPVILENRQRQQAGSGVSTSSRPASNKA